MDDAAPEDPQLYAAVAAFVVQARDAYREAADVRAFASYDSTFPTSSTFQQSGLPSISPGISAKVMKYDGLFTLQEGRWPTIVFGEWESWQRLVQTVEANRRLVQFMGLPPGTVPVDEDRRRMWLISIQLIPLGIFDRLMHLVGVDFDDADLRNIYLPVERYLLHDRLDVSFAVPIVLTRFALPDHGFALSGAAGLLEMTEDMQLARVSEFQVGTTVNRNVLSAATHAFVLSDWWISNDHELALGDDRLDWYPLDRIDQFFHALRVVTGIDTGYAQVFMLPMGWARRWRAHLPPIETGALGRRYPSHFEDGGWLREAPVVSESEVAEVAKVYSELIDAPQHLQLAARRLSSGMLREDEADRILDLCIGLEAVLGDPKSRTEIVHKLGMRVAAVLAADSSVNAPARQVFGDVKDIYDYRSAVAHGGADAEKKRHLRDADGKRTDTRPAAEAARDYLRCALRTLLARPELHNPQTVDQRLILDVLDAAGNASSGAAAPE